MKADVTTLTVSPFEGLGRRWPAGGLGMRVRELSRALVRIEA